jgi:PAS domain S-box-containing protein
MKTVLLVYERDQDLAAVESVMQARGHRVLKARTGIEALEAIRGDDAPDAVVSDVLLPRLDGFALCRRLREDPSFLHLPFLLHSFRVEGPKYEAFAAEVGAHRFLPRGSTLDEVAAALEAASPGSGTARMPALVPELLELREQDRRRLCDLERQVRELESRNQALAVAARATADGATEETRLELAKLAALESRLVEQQTARARAQSAANDAERAFALQPTPTFIVDVESRLVHAASESAAALTGTEPEALRGKPIQDLLGEVDFSDDAALQTILWRHREDGSRASLELRHTGTSFAGRACWLVTARDVTDELALRARERIHALGADALESAAAACGIVDSEGQLQYANAALLEVLGVDRAGLASVSLQSLELESSADATVRTVQLHGRGHRIETRWRRADGMVLDVELALAPCGDDHRVVTVRDVSAGQRAEQRNERDRQRVTRLLELAQRAHGLNEIEILDRVLALLQDLTCSPLACVFLTTADAPDVELVACRGGIHGDERVAMLPRWRGAPPAGSALFECIDSQRTVVRDSSESAGELGQAGLPVALSRQVVIPMLEGGRLAGVVLVADAPTPYDDDDRRHVAQVADATWKLIRRRRSDTEIVRVMDHMERVTFGAIESLARLAEIQDACKIGRSARVADYAAGIGAALGLPGHAVRGLRVMGQLIDVGMLQIPRELLWRPGALTSSEFELVKTHAERGFEVLRGIEFPWPVAEVVRQHHERIDGSGYPRGLIGDDILLEARIVAVADTVEAMLAQRPHRAALSLAACIEELQSQAGRRYDARVVKACVKLLCEGQAPGSKNITDKGEAPVGQRIA